MDKINQDGNVVGRIGALAVIVAVAIGVAKISGVNLGFCPLLAGQCCDGPASPSK